MRAVFLLLSLLLLKSGYAMDPPAIVWVKYFFAGGRSYLFSIQQLMDQGYIAVGFKSQGPGAPSDSCLFRFSQNGDLLWSKGVSGFTWDIANWAEELSDGALIVTGSCKDVNETSHGLFLSKFDSSGDEIWVRFYDSPATNDQGNCVIALDDGYAIAGDRGDDAWIIRTDLQGDSLWSVRVSDPHYLNARRILLVDDALVTYITGINPRIVALSVDDGQLLWEADDFPSAYPSYDDDYGDMTCSTTDGGYTLVTAFYPNIVHTDEFGNVLWYYEVPYWSCPFSSSISNTMDGGYIYGGINTEQPDDPGSNYSGMVVKFDSEGNEHWRDYVYECIDLFCIRQLSSGGYIACGAKGGQGTLLRYAPETGIEGESITGGLTITSLSTNPFSSVLEVQFSVPECSQVDLCVYDLYGRLTATVEHDVFPAGDHSAQWVPEGVPSGCYLVRLSTPGTSVVRRCVYIE